MTTYAIGDAKYPFSSFWVIARMLLMRTLRRGFRRRFFSRDLQENLFEAHAHRTQLEQPPAAPDDRGGQLAPHIASGAGHLVADDAAARGRHRHAGDAGHARERAARVDPA